MQAEQVAVEGRLVELVGMDAINTGLKNTAIKGEDDMDVEPPPEPYTNPILEAKRKALSRFVRLYFIDFHSPCSRYTYRNQRTMGR